MSALSCQLFGKFRINRNTLLVRRLPPAKSRSPSLPAGSFYGGYSSTEKSKQNTRDKRNSNLSFGLVMCLRSEASSSASNAKQKGEFPKS